MNMRERRFEGIVSYQPKGVRPFEDYMHVNFDRELERVLGLALDAPPAARCPSLLFFGYQGNGKNAFARRLTQVLFDRGYGAVWLDFEVLRIQPRKALLSVAERVRESLRFKPTILVGSNLDMVATSFTDPEDYLAQLTATIASSVEPNLSNQLVVAATAEQPALALPFLPRSTSIMYFDWPSEHMASEIFRLLDFCDHDELAASLLDEARERRVRYTARSLIMGARQARRLASRVEKLATRSLRDSIELISAMCSATPEDEAVGYEIDQETHIRLAQEAADPATYEKEGRLPGEDGLRS
jgi:SpoVK/Ycf46/Vps4 family AAA+-type ATPase